MAQQQQQRANEIGKQYGVVCCFLSKHANCRDGCLLLLCSLLLCCVRASFFDVGMATNKTLIANLGETVFVLVTLCGATRSFFSEKRGAEVEFPCFDTLKKYLVYLEQKMNWLDKASVSYQETSIYRFIPIL